MHPRRYVSCLKTEPGLPRTSGPRQLGFPVFLGFIKAILQCLMRVKTAHARELRRPSICTLPNFSSVLQPGWIEPWHERVRGCRRVKNSRPAARRTDELASR